MYSDRSVSMACLPSSKFLETAGKKSVSLQSPICSCEETRFIRNWFYIRRQICCAPIKLVPFVRPLAVRTTTIYKKSTATPTLYCRCPLACLQLDIRNRLECQVLDPNYLLT